MSIDEDKTATLRAQEHGHQPVICFEPGIMQRPGREPNVNVSTTLRNNPGDNRPAVCYAIDCRNATLTNDVTHTIQAKANGGISLNCTPSVLIVDNHPQDSRVTLNNTGVVQTLSAQMGLGG